jgi:hypothetical protein
VILFFSLFYFDFDSGSELLSSWVYFWRPAPVISLRFSTAACILSAGMTPQGSSFRRVHRPVRWLSAQVLCLGSDSSLLVAREPVLLEASHPVPYSVFGFCRPVLICRCRIRCLCCRLFFLRADSSSRSRACARSDFPRPVSLVRLLNIFLLLIRAWVQGALVRGPIFFCWHLIRFMFYVSSME